MAEPKGTRTLNLPRTGVLNIRGYFIALLATALPLALSFPRPGWWPLAYVALFPAAILALRATNVRRLAWTSFVVFSAWWLWMSGWLIPVTLGGYIALSFLQGAYFMLALLVFRVLHRNLNFAAVIALPMAWVAVELVRVNFPAGGFGWFVLGHSQASYLVSQGAGRIAQMSDLFGEHTISFYVALFNGLLVDLMTRPIMHPSKRGGRRFSPVLRAGLILWVMLFAGAMIYGQLRISGQQRAWSRGPKISVVQTNVPQDNKRFATPEQQKQNWAAMLKWTEAAAVQKPDLIAWPETMVPKPVNPEARTFEWEQGITEWGVGILHSQIADRALAYDTNLIVGTPSYMELQLIPSADGQGAEIAGRRANSAILYYSDGEQEPQRYDKMHRVPFGEYIPWVENFATVKNLFIRYLTPYDSDYTLVPGTQFTIFTINIKPPPPPPEGEGASSPDVGSVAEPDTVRFATPICYEDVSPRIVRRMVYNPGGTKRVDLLVNLTNSAWFSGWSQRLQHIQIATLRSIENRVPTARSVNSGISGFVDSVGRVKTVV